MITINNDIYYINLIIEGNTNAFNILVDRYKDLVFSLALKMVKNREEAEEVAQDTFIKVFKSLSKFKGDSKFSTWIYKIGYYASLDVVKKNKRQINSINIDEFNEGNIGSMQDGLKYLEAKERKKVINDALLRLDEDEQVILTLYYFEEMPLKEISKVVNLSLENIKVKLFRARKKLFSLLKNVIEPRTINLI